MSLWASTPLKRKRVKNELSEIFNYKKKSKSSPWRHRFLCLAHMDQDRMPRTDFEKDELQKAGLGEKEIVSILIRKSSSKLYLRIFLS
jgi:hypothetical protein